MNAFNTFRISHQSEIDLPMNSNNEISQGVFLDQNERLPNNKTYNCIMCSKIANYECPKCHIHYCSLDCYKKHNQECTDKFYHEHMTEILKNKKATLDEKKKMNRILNDIKNMEDVSQTSEKEIERLEELLRLLELDELTIDKLTLKEQKNFAEFIQDPKKLKKYIKEWIPWWKKDQFAYAIDIEIMDEPKPIFKDKKEEKLYDYRRNLRQRYKNIPDINQLTYVCRQYNGDLKRSCIDISFAIMTIAEIIEKKMDVPNTRIALDSAIIKSIELDNIRSKAYIDITLQDICDILSTKFYLFETFYKFYDILHYAHEKLEQEIELIDDNDNQNKEKDSKIDDNKMKSIKRILNVKKKIIFYMSYFKLKQQYEFDLLATQVKEYINDLSSKKKLFSEMESYMKNTNQNEIRYKNNV